MQRLVAALLVATAAAGKVTVQYRNELLYSGVTPKLHLQGSGFGGDGTNIELTFFPKLAREKYSVLVTSETALSVLLKGSATWPLGAGQSESSLYLTGYRDDTQSSENLLEEPIMAATVLSTPTVVKHEDRLLYMSASLKLLITGTAFRAKQTQLTFDPPLYKDVDYVLQIKSPRVAQLSLKTGRKWRSDGNPGPLKLKRIDTGAGALRIDAKYGGVTVAEVQANLGGHGVTVETTSDKKYYQSASELKVIGHGFNETAPLNRLRWGNRLQGRGVNYTVTGATTNALTLSLLAGSKWRPNAANLPGPLTLLAVDAGAGLVPVGATDAKKGRVVATIYADPSLHSDASREIYRTLTHELWLVGNGFVRGSTTVSLIGEAEGETLELRPFVDYLLSVFNATHARLALRDGKAWASKAGGVLKCIALDTGAGPAPTVSKEMPRILGKIAEDAMHASGAQITPTASTQTLYETPALRHLKISGSSLCAKKYSGTDALVEFVPAISTTVFKVTKVTPNEIQLVLNAKQKWPVGVLYVGHITCGDKSRRKFAGGSGVGVATVLADPVVDAHPELKLYGTHSKRLVVRGSGFSPDGTSLTLEPTRAAKYSVIEATEWSVTLELKPEGMWVEALGNKSVELKVTKIDSGAGEVIFDKPIIVATVEKEPEGDICDDSCEWALDGICDDGTTPNESDDGYGQWDDDYGEYGDDNNYYAGFYDDSYGALFDDEGSLPACAYGTDCTDCQPLHGDATKKEQASVECDNTCAYARDGFCDDPRQGGECALGTDCQDCGPASKANYTNYEDDTWWDDDEQNWYWDDDYFADGDDERRHFEDVDDATKKAEKDDDAVGYVKSADPFATEPDEDTGAAATLLVTALLVMGALLGCCAIFRVARGDKCIMGKGDRKEDLAQAWSEMTERSDKKKADVPLTPDVSFTDAMV
jgi:hypothetical protein